MISPTRHLGIAWIMLGCALAAHVTDEALTGFLDIYNRTVLEIGQCIGVRPPAFDFTEWLAGLVVGICIVLALTPVAFANRSWWRPLARAFALLMLLNGLGHIAGTVAGRTFRDITFPRPMPGFYSSPLLLAASSYLLVCLRRTRARAATSP